MGLFPMNVGGGGTLSETVLWTNPSPTAAFDGQTLSLSDSLSNYDYVKIDYRASTTNATESSMIIPISSFYVEDTVTVSRSIAVKLSNSWYERLFNRSNNMGVIFANCIKRKDNSGTATNIFAIPTKISGLK